MDRLTHLVDRLIEPIDRLIKPASSSFEAVLADVNRVGEQRAAGVDPASVTAFSQLDPFAFQKTPDVTVKFFFLDRFHRCSIFGAKSHA